MGIKDGMVPFISSEEIQEMVKFIAHDIERDYSGKEIVLICPLKGSCMFVADLCRKIQLPQIVDFVHVTSPKGEGVRILKDISVDISGKHVIIVEEIIDAGRTIDDRFVIGYGMDSEELGRNYADIYNYAN